MDRVCYQVNLQQGQGGGEIYTRFLSRALLDLGWEVHLLVRPGSYLSGLKLPGLVLHPVAGEGGIAQLLPPRRSLVIAHNPAVGPLLTRQERRHFLTTFAHMPLYGRDPEPYRAFDLVFGVSRHVIDSMTAAGLANGHPEPLYGVAELERGEHGPLVARSPYDWDRRKVRDRLLAWLEPLAVGFAEPLPFIRRPGLSLGVVSRITPIKQFPQMFDILGPILARFPTVNLEIFGGGGYASVRDLKHSLAPFSGQVRWWGHQASVAAVYPQLDFLLTGLPEKEALGLNVIEAQACGTPVLAVDAPPFIETVADGRTGYLYVDPRRDGGADFAALLEDLVEGRRERPQPLAAREHLEMFSFPRFVERVARAMDHAVALAGMTG